MANGLGKIMRGAASWLPASIMRPFGRPTALFFHGVEREILDPRVQSNHHDADAFFEIAHCLSDNFEVLPLSDLTDAMRNPRRHRRAVFLMCDDGYANNRAAANILQSFGLPWTLFVSTFHIDTAERSPMFVARLFFFLAPERRYEIPYLGAIELRSDRQRQAVAECYGLRLKALDAASANEAVAAMREELPDISTLLERFRSDAFLTWPEVKELKKQGVEIGAHAHMHWAMHGGQSREYLRDQAMLSKARIEAEIGSCHAFAYPFGNTSDVCRDAWHAVRDAGFEYGFTTLSGSLDASRTPFLMPRYGLAMRENNLPSLAPALRLGNARLTSWQRLMRD